MRPINFCYRAGLVKLSSSDFVNSFTVETDACEQNRTLQDCTVHRAVAWPFGRRLCNFEGTVELPQQNCLLAFNQSSCTDAGSSHAQVICSVPSIFSLLYVKNGAG